MPRAPLHQIKASAGSGKTHALTGGILDLLAGAAPPAGSGCRAGGPPGSAHEYHGWDEILAVTFTNRAASEMKERVLARLKDTALASAPPEPGWSPESAARAVEGLLRDFGSLNIRTIDSLLHLIVRLAALDLDLPPDFEPSFDDGDVFAPLIDDLAERAREGDPDLEASFREACRQTLLLADYPGFLAGDVVRGRIADLASYLLGRQDDPSLARLSAPADIAARLRGLYADLREAGTLLTRELEHTPDVNANLRKALAKCADPACADVDLPSKSKMLQKACLDDCLNAKAKGTATDRAEALYARLAGAAAAVETEGAILRSALRLMPFTDLARRLLAALPAFQRKNGIMPASRIPALASETLRGAYGVNEAFCRMGSRLTHILVDEFQDTSVEQWAAMKPLVEEALSRQGSLTIVGDVKQAIYGWRGGEAALFDLVPADPSLLRLAPEPRLSSLDLNRRSKAEIVAWNNAFFAPLADPRAAARILSLMLPPVPTAAPSDISIALPDILADAAALLARSFANAEQKVPSRKEGGTVRLYALPDADADGALADLLPEIVEGLGQEHSWGSLCILTRTNAQTSLAAGWLLARGIPVVTQGSLLLAEQPLIAQTAALLAFLNDPDDDNAFWAVLTGRELLPPTYGAKDTEPSSVLDRTALFEWAAARALDRHYGGRPGGRRGSLAQDFRAAFSEMWEALFAPLADAAALLTPYDATCEIFRRWRVRERHPGAEGFLLRFLEVLHGAERRGLTDLAGFLDYWKTHGEREKAPLPESMNAVNIMTVHKAKGLQFDIVLAPWHDFTLRAGREPRVWEGNGLTVLAPLSAALGEPYYQALADNAREALNLVYVAWTRAVSQLHVFLPPADSGPFPAALHALLPEGAWEQAVADSETSLDTVRNSACAGGSLPSDPVVLEEGELLAMPGEASRQTGPAPDTAWRPMDWLPRLKIFRSPLEEWTFTGTRRGILAHACLERLKITGMPREDAEAAVARGLESLPLSQADKEAVRGELADMLAWYAALPEARDWLAKGTPEQTVLDENGAARRVDLLVDNGHELAAVEYKTGTAGPLPAPEHVEQLTGYLDLLERATGLPSWGVLVYLDRREVFRFGAERMSAPFLGEDA